MHQNRGAGRSAPKDRFRHLSLRLLAAIAASCIAVPAPVDAAFTAVRVLTIDANEVGGTTGALTDFPVLIRITDHELKTTVNGGKVTDANGDDIIFQAFDANTCGGPAPCTLDHELEAYDGTLGTVLAWVRIPSLSKSDATLIGILFGDSTITLPTEQPALVWDPNYEGVWHLDENPAGAPPQFLESTSNPNDGTASSPTPFQVAGHIDQGLQFDDTNERHVNVPDDASLRFATNMTVSAWVTTTDSDPSAAVILNKWQGGGSKNYWLGKLDGSSMLFQVHNDTYRATGPLALVNDGLWHHVVGVADASGGGDVRLYIDGVEVGNDPAYPGTSETGTSPFQIGKSADVLTQTWLGDIDEAQVSNQTLSDDWILTSFKNQKSPHPFFQPIIHYRSIGTRPNYGTAEAEGPGTTVSATTGSAVVTGVGTAWRSANRGRGDRITIDGVDYTVFYVATDNTLTMTTPFIGTTGSTKSYTIARKFATFSTWETCVDATTPCQGVGSASLVADNRAEVGMAYKDSPFTAPVRVDGAVTDSVHTITLTADFRNRHLGVAGAGVMVDMTGFGVDAFEILDDHVIVEWLEFFNGPNNRDAVRMDNSTAGNNQIVLRFLLLHDLQGDGIHMSDTDTNLDVFNSIIYEADVGIQIVSVASSQIRILNNTVFSCNGLGASPTGINSTTGTNPTVTLRNNLVHGNNNGDIDVNAPNAASSHNLTSDTSGTAHSPAGGGIDSEPLVNLNFVNTTAGSENLHIQSGSTAIDVGANLSAVFKADIDLDQRGLDWDIGADEFIAPTNYRSIGTRPNYGTSEPEGATTTITTTAGSPVVTGASTTWSTSNRGRGDRISFGGNDYTISSVDSATQLTLTAPSLTTGSGTAYTIARQYTRLPDWEDCIDGGPCPFFAVGSSSLVTDNRSEVGIVYRDSPLTDALNIDGSITDATHTITLTADAGNRHYGVAGAPGVNALLDNGANPAHAIEIRDDHVTIERLEIIGGGAGREAIRLSSLGGGGNNQVVIHKCLIHDVTGGSGILVFDADSRADIFNNIIYETEFGVRINNTLSGTSSRVRILNNTIFSSNETVSGNPTGISALAGTNPTVTLQNNIAHSNFNGDFGVAVPGTSSNNLSSDGTGEISGIALGAMNFVSTAGGSEDLHVTAGSAAADVGTDLSGFFQSDIDDGARIGLWDVGADDVEATTAVELTVFEVSALDEAVELRWSTASELSNLGFHIYRRTSGTRTYERITPRLIPGLGSSPAGASYTYTDTGLENGVTYDYELEDIETTGETQRHGPVSATPEAGAVSESEPPPFEEDDVGARVSYGEPEASSFHIAAEKNGVVLVLETGGFVAIPQDDGTVRLEVPGLQDIVGSSLPVKRAWVEAIAERDVKLVSIRAREVERFDGLHPSGALVSEIAASPRGTVQARLVRRGRRVARREGASLIEVAYQGETKKALFELSPLTWDGTGLVLAKKLEVHVAFRGREPKTSVGRVGKRNGQASLRLATVERGLYAVSLELLGRRRAQKTKALRLSRQGESVAYHRDNDTVYFWSEGAAANPYGTESVYELELGVSGEAMEVVGDAPSSGHTFYWHELEREENRYYQAALVHAPDVWLWELLFAPDRKSFTFDVTELADVAESSTVDVWLQGTSDFPRVEDHHVRVFVNGSFVAESRWDGKTAHKIEAELGPGILREGENVVELESLADTGAAQSMVMLDRFRIRYPRDVAPLENASYVLDITQARPRWMASRSSFDLERDYVGVDELLRPEVRNVSLTKLRKRRRADYLVIGPASFLDAAEPLLRHRKRQGLRVAKASTEAIASEFGHGELTPDAIREFIAYTYHEWRAPKLRYVLLLGDATYDFKDYLGSGVTNQLPPYMVRTSYLWTASDPAYAAVNGDDLLPDVAIGRLPARSPRELAVMVAKILDYESAELSPDAPFVLAADNADAAGDFESDAEELASSLLAGRDTTRIYLSQLGASATRDAIVGAFDAGASTVSYIGHGGIHLWADENLFNASKVELLSPQARQPILFTMNCLNGYFHFPFFDALSEALLKPGDKGVIAAFSPSGLSLNAPAHRYHKALLNELVNGNHSRLGDAVLAAQQQYADTGAFPELLAIYHLFGDPALQVK